MIANKVVHGIRSKKDHGFLLKVDFHKAFDSILWEHIDSTMGYMGFGTHWRKLIFECLSTSKLAILINDSPNREFSMERGLRQGDPLSPFLFDIAVQGLTILFNRASDSGYFKGLQTFPGHYITHLQYADDTLIFLSNDYSSLLHAKRILHWFEIISGLKVNFYKSSLIGINVDNEYTSGLANAIFYRSDTFPIKYLGLPLGANTNRLSTWKPVLSTIRAKLSIWKGEFLSMAGRICLIKSILNSLPLYYMSVFTMPKGITKAISSINRCFLWKGTSNSHGICKVAWHKVIKSKPLGGLGLGSIHSKNLALMFKWLWNLDKGVVGGWQELILRKYRSYFANGLPVFASSLSPTWRGMVFAISLNHNIAAPLQSNVRFKVGDGRNIRFWSDSWLGYAAPLQFMFPRLYNLSLQQSLSIAEVHNPTDNSINLS
jgi:mannosylglycoprotein endo-beta-mannosidase